MSVSRRVHVAKKQLSVECFQLNGLTVIWIDAKELDLKKNVCHWHWPNKL